MYMYMIFLMFIFMINIMFLNFNNPLIMGILMIIQTLNIIFIIGKIHYSFWFPLIIFLVFVGGLFILFIYMISLTYNNKLFSLNYKYYYIILTMLLIIFLYKNIYLYMNNESKKNLMMKENMMNLLKFFNFPNNILNISLIVYLLILMIIVVKITNFYKGPLKMKKY